MICSKCGKEVGNLFCGHCRKELQSENNLLIPVLYYDPQTKLYRPACSVLECPCNDRGVCSSRISLDTFITLCHEYDGDNCIKQVCG